MPNEQVERTPRVNMVGFAEYVGAPTSGRLDCVQRQLRNYDADYRPGADFYKDFVDALQAGRHSNSDELSLQRSISRQNVPARAKHYRDLRQHWLAMPELHLPMASIQRTFWNVPGLRVSVAPELALQRADGILVIKLWLRQPEPAADSIKAMHWLLVTHMPDIAEGGTPAVLDLRRQKLHLLPRRNFRRGYDELLRLEAESMGRLWQRLARTA